MKALTIPPFHDSTVALIPIMCLFSVVNASFKNRLDTVFISTRTLIFSFFFSTSVSSYFMNIE